MTGHVHAALMLQYAQDAAEHAEPWKLWQYLHAGVWCDLVEQPSWIVDSSYRRKPRTIRIGAFNVPEPFRQPIAKGTKYWSPHVGAQDFTTYSYWHGDRCDFQWLERGIIHLTEDAARLHAQALLSLSAP